MTMQLRSSHVTLLRTKFQPFICPPIGLMAPGGLTLALPHISSLVAEALLFVCFFTLDLLFVCFLQFEAGCKLDSTRLLGYGITYIHLKFKYTVLASFSNVSPRSASLVFKSLKPKLLVAVWIHGVCCYHCCNCIPFYYSHCD